MAQFTFQKATKKKAKARIGLIGPSGSGKTFSALRIAGGLGGRIALVDTERGSASKYAGEPRIPAFDVLELETFAPQNYIDAIHAAEEAGYDVLIIDSLSHAWMGKGGALEMVDKAAKRGNGNSFGAWRDVTPLHNAMIDAILGAKLHVIATLRSKTEYVQEKDERTGKTSVRKIGMAPVQRDGLEYEFDVVAEMNWENEMIVTKSRCNALNQAVISKPGEDVATTIRNWLEGEPAQQQAPRTVDQDTGEITEPGHETRQQARERIQRQAPAVAGACEVQAGPSEAHPAASSIIGHCANCGRALADNVVRSYRQHGVADNQMLCSKCRKEQAAAKPQEQAAQPAQAVEQPALPSENNPDGDADLASRFGDEDPFAG